MCLLVLYLNPSALEDEYYLILINIRDEMFHRPTQLASFWENHPSVIGGMDLEPGREGGSWLVMNKSGKIGALLNILQPDEEVLPNKKGRGFLAVDYVVGTQDNATYLQNIASEKKNYNGFLLVTLDIRWLQNPKLSYFTNMTDFPPTELQPGIHAFGNSSPIKPWPKVIKAKECFSEIVSHHSSVSTKEVLVEELFSLLQDRTCYPLDEQMKQQGKSKSESFMNRLSAVFVHIPEASYGSRCHTVILIDGSGKVDYFERSRNEKAPPDSEEKWSSKHYSFKLNS